MRPVKSAVLLLLLPCLLGGLLGGAPAAGAAPPFEAVNKGLTDGHVIPRVERLAEETRALSRTTGSYCTGEADAPLAPVKAGFQAAMDAWMTVQHVPFGPVELLMRNYRLYFWPESRGRMEDAMAKLLDAEDSAVLAPEAFRNASVAVQGFPAVENLLYERRAAPGTYECDLLVAITGGMATMAEGILADWTAGETPFRETVLSPGPDNWRYATPEEVTLAYFQGFHNTLEALTDVRLKPVIGDSIEHAKPELAESTASDRSLRNVTLILESLAAMYRGENGPGLAALLPDTEEAKELDALMRKAFTKTIAGAHAIPGSLDDAVIDPARRPEIETLFTRVLAIKQIVRTELAPATGLGVGFNALDGD